MGAGSYFDGALPHNDPAAPDLPTSLRSVPVSAGHSEECLDIPAELFDSYSRQQWAPGGQPLAGAARTGVP